MITAKIYGLVDPRNDSIFYVGVTINKLKDRLSNHLTKPQSIPYSGFVMQRYKLIKEISKSGNKTQILHLADVPKDNIDHCEKFYYMALLNQGYNLIQADYQFCYSKKRLKPKSTNTKKK